MVVVAARAVHRWYLAIGLALCALYLVLPPSTQAQFLFLVIALSVPIVAAFELVRRRSPARIAWLLLCVGFSICATGELIDFVTITLGHRPSFEPITNVVFLTGYIVQLCGLMAVYQAQTASKHRLGWYDAAAVGIVVFTVVWSTMYEAIFGSGYASPYDLFTRFGSAVVDVALVVTAARLVFGRDGRRAPMVLLLAGFSAQMIGDDVAALWSGYASGGALDTLWAVAYVLCGAAMIHPERHARPRQVATRVAKQEIKHTLVLQAVVMIGLAVMVVVEIDGSVRTAILVMWGGAWLLILLVTRIRVLGLLQMVGEVAVTENQRRLTAMVASSSDVIGLADPDGLVRYLTPSAEDLFDVPVADLLGQRFTEVLPCHVRGLEDLGQRTATLAGGEQATWECAVGPTSAHDQTRTIKLTIANQLDTPEVNGWVITATDVTDEARLTAELRHQSLHDTLTGLPNRALLFDRIEHSLNRLSRSGDAAIAVVLVDIDDFKAVNDSLGHNTGDELLRSVAIRLATSVRHGDTVARLGGDEFAILLEGTDEADAMVLAQRALESLALPVHIDTGDFAVRASAGVVCHRGAASAMDLLRSADIAMYAAKREGKARVVLFQEHMHDTAREQLALRMDLDGALERDEFAIVYQPIVDMQTQRASGVEALLRWHHPTRGTVSPLEFIPLAEQSGTIRAIGEWVLVTACTEAAAWPAPAAPYVSVNVSPTQLGDARFVEIVLAALRASGLPPRRLLLEITESMLVDESVNASAVLGQLRAVGVRIAIDDFGTGYSSLAYLRELCVDVVKIDQSFVRDLGTNTDRQALTRTILALAEGLEMTAIAEGVETDLELAELSRLGCIYAQGYLFSRPVAAADVRRVLRELDGERSPA